jgi:N-acetylglucosaminyldiphosphoundecaprenol N-acetyl-beta-D-mannosaminyltransferase
MYARTLKNNARSSDRANVLGCEIDRLDMDQTIQVCERAVLKREQVQHVAINAAKLVAMQSDPALREIIARCELVTADGQSVVWASRLLGDPLPCRVAGVDLMHCLFELADSRGYGIYVLGAQETVLEQAVERIRRAHPNLKIVGYRHGYFDESEESAIAKEISYTRPDMLFVAISSPRKEVFLGGFRDELQVPFIMGVGGAIDIVAGITRRAPKWMQRFGLEWLYRLLQEPKRMFRRYLSTNAIFMGLVARAVAGRRR